jgi:hypothetical protein
MDLQFIITSIIIPVMLGILTGGLGVVIYNSWQDRRKAIKAQPIEQKKLELDATDRVIENILSVQESVVQENKRLNERINETNRQIRETTTENAKQFKDMQVLLDEALRKIDAYRRYIMRVRRELAAQNIQMPEPDPQDIPLIGN